MNTSPPAVSSPQARRPYVAPKLTVYGPATVLTQDPQSRPRETTPSGGTDVRILFLGDNA